MSRYYVGLMSGTSIDSIDAALVDLSSATPAIIHTHSHPIPADTRHAILALCQPGENEIQRMGQLDVQIGHLFAIATRALLSDADTDASQIIAIGSHGQTIRHEPDSEYAFSLQIGNPAVIALQTGITTVTDFRNADIAAGGQGAPLAPVFHKHVFGSRNINRVILNIGGIANITVLSSDAGSPVTGFDTGPGNILMDAWMQEYFNENFDNKGELAAQGNADSGLLNTLLSDPYFPVAPPKSTGRERFNLNWLSDHLDSLNKPFDPTVILSTLSDLTATSIADAIIKYAPGTAEVLVCGGGAHNKTLLNKLSAQLNDCEVATTGKYGIDPDWMEAVAFAWLAKLALDGTPGNLPSVTGAKHNVILGGIYKAAPNSARHSRLRPE